MSEPNKEVILDRLEEQICWYDKKSKYNQNLFKILKGTVIVAATAIPVCAGVGVSNIVIGSLGGLIVIIESIQQLNQYHHNWISYRSTCEALKHEKYLYHANAGIYSQAEKPLVVLAENTESLVSQEHSKWISARKKAEKCLQKGNS